MAERNEKGQFVKGKSGNPGGRPKIPDNIKENLEDLVPKSVKTLSKMLNSKNQNVQLRAAVAVLDRVYGRPGQAVSINEGEGGVNIIFGDGYEEFTK